jgi:transcriptional regulator with XRE-family HTH domain
MNLKEIRTARGYTQKEVADALQLQTVTYNRYETGARDIPVSVLSDLADFYGVTVDSLACVGDSIRPYGPVGCILFTTDDAEEMFRLIQRVNDTVRIQNTDGENVLIYYDDFDYLRRVYREGLEGK